jgi:superoxide dismutase, Fe-Mn family
MSYAVASKLSYTLPHLPYAYDALEPYIDARTMVIHHTKHHQTYINNAIAALSGHEDLLGLAPEELLHHIESAPEDQRQAVINNVGGHANHSLFWTLLAPRARGKPWGELATAIDKNFGSFDAFKVLFTKAALGRFGAGWAWLGFERNGKLYVGSTANQDSPLLTGRLPILGLDVWEHAYYLQYQNRRSDYVAAWWNVVNWERVAQLYELGK